KLDGLCSTPSMAAPSWLFQETTSSAPVAQLVVCALKSVSFLAVRPGAASVRVSPDATHTSAILLASAPRYAHAAPSADSEKFELTLCSTGPIFTIVFDAGSRRNR